MKGCRPRACGSLGAGEAAREPEPQGQGQGRGGVAWGHLEDSEGAAGPGMRQQGQLKASVGTAEPAWAGTGPYLGRGSSWVQAVLDGLGCPAVRVSVWAKPSESRRSLLGRWWREGDRGCGREAKAWAGGPADGRGWRGGAGREGSTAGLVGRRGRDQGREGAGFPGPPWQLQREQFS